MPRPDVRDERRPQIIAAAARVFGGKGYHQATMPDIAKEAGLSIGGVYWYFKSKDAIVIAILEQLFDSDLRALDALLAADAPAAERLRGFAERMITTYAEQRWMLSAGPEIYAAAAHDPQTRHLVTGAIARYRAGLSALIAQGVARGELRPIDPDDAANTLIALEEGLALITTIDPAGVRYEASMRLAIELFVRGLLR